MSYSGEHFERWVAYLESLSNDDRLRLATLYDAAGSEPRTLAAHMCDAHEFVCSVVAREVGQSEAHTLLLEIAMDHDLEVPVLPSPIAARRVLVKLGLLRDTKSSHITVPGVWAAILAPMLVGTRTSLLTLLGTRSDEQLAHMARAWGVSGPRRMQMILGIAECLGGENAMSEIVERLPDLDYMGAAMVAIELGGICYWQEVFGYDLEPALSDAKVLPFMRRDDRAMERDIAQTLETLGVVFRIDEGELSMLVVPEELWQGLWELGRSWLLDWLADSYEGVSLTAHRKDETERHDLQSTLKWLALEADAGALGWHVDGMDAATFERLARVGGHDAAYWESKVNLGIQLGALIVDGPRLVSNPAFETTLDLARPAFVRHVLLEWCTGFVGAGVDASLPKAVGLEDHWRKQLLMVLARAKDFIPVWMTHEGVEPMLTGSGCLRDVDDSPEELLIAELGIANAAIWTTKLVWLDMISMLGNDYWYSPGALSELLQIVGAFSTFSHVLQVLEQPELGYYIPLQRASFMTDPYHAAEFESWLSDIVEHLLEPLGVAHRHSETGSIWLDTGLLRIQTPPGLMDMHRQSLMQDIFNDERLTFEIPGPSILHLHRVPALRDPARADLDVPLAVLRDWLSGRQVTSFDGQRLHVD
ncbi:MAG: hypothetical protein R3E66_10815 [bacterium]